MNQKRGTKRNRLNRPLRREQKVWLLVCFPAKLVSVRRWIVEKSLGLGVTHFSRLIWFGRALTTRDLLLGGFLVQRRELVFAAVSHPLRRVSPWPMKFKADLFCSQAPLQIDFLVNWISLLVVCARHLDTLGDSKCAMPAWHGAATFNWVLDIKNTTLKEWKKNVKCIFEPGQLIIFFFTLFLVEISSLQNSGHWLFGNNDELK
jgi:hypothetical protein